MSVQATCKQVRQLKKNKEKSHQLKVCRDIIGYWLLLVLICWSPGLNPKSVPLMADRNHHDDLTIKGRLLETFQGIKSGLLHATEIFVAPKPINVMGARHDSIKELPVFTLAENECNQKDKASSTTFIYEQATIGGNQHGPLRVYGHARER